MVFCGDGATWIWRRVEGLVEKLGIEEAEIYQVIDYTHAKQNLRKIAELIPEKDGKREKIYRKWKRMLWEGDIYTIKDSTHYHSQTLNEVGPEVGRDRHSSLPIWISDSKKGN